MISHQSQLVADVVPLTRTVAASAEATDRLITHQALISLPATDGHVRTTRKFASAVLGQWHLDPEDRDSAVLIISELAANSSQHGRSEMTVRLALGQQLLSISVSDSGNPCPADSESVCPDPDEHGRGLVIVEHLAHWFAINSSDNGYRVDVDLLLTSLEP